MRPTRKTKKKASSQTWIADSVPSDLSEALQALDAKIFQNLSQLKVEADVASGALVLTCDGVSAPEEVVLRWK